MQWYNNSSMEIFVSSPKVSIIPSLLTNDYEELQKLVELSSTVDRIHIDIIDGSFADNKTIFPVAMKLIETKSKIDYHLMVDEPFTWLHACEKADRIIAQVEMMKVSQSEFLSDATQYAINTGLAVDLDTPITKLDNEIFPKVDVILVMSVKAGFGGQKFEVSALEKVKQLKRIKDENGYRYQICVDGGITTDNVKRVVEAGADEVVVGRRLFDGNMEENIKKYLEAAYV